MRISLPKLIFTASFAALMVGCGQQEGNESARTETAEAKTRRLQIESQEAQTKSIQDIDTGKPDGKTKFDFLKEK